MYIIASHTTACTFDMISSSLYAEEMLQAVTEAVFAVLDARLQRQHRLLVATCFGLVTLNMTCEEEDYVKAFLVPLNLDQTCLWEGVVPPTEKKEEAECDEEVKEKESVGEEGKDKEEEIDGKQSEGKSDDKREPEVRPDEVLAEHDDETLEALPSWIPSGCNKKVRFTKQLHGDVKVQLNCRT